jgi:hypothetical protein
MIISGGHRREEQATSAPKNVFAREIDQMHSSPPGPTFQTAERLERPMRVEALKKRSS